MNSKKILATLSLVLFFVLLQQMSFAQTGFSFSTVTGTGTFNITISALSDSNPTQTNPLPFYTFFIETGNGRYKKITQHIYGPYSNPPYPVQYNQAIPSGKTAFLNLVGHYDTIKPPNAQLVFSNTSNPNGIQLSSQDSLGSAKIGFNYSDKTIVPGDTTTVVLTYKPDLLAKTGSNISGNYLVAFFYNDTINGGKIFDEINDTAKKYPFAGENYTVISKNVIRMHNGEMPYISLTANPPAGIPRQVYSSLSAAKGSFKNALYFFVPSTPVEEKNIFLSLAPSNSLSTYVHGSQTTFRALLIKYNSSILINQVPANDTLNIAQYARDPNGISTFPHCLDSLSPYNKPVKYIVDFQNDGNGKAHDVEVTVFIPEGIKLPPDNFIFSNTIGGRINLSFIKWTTFNFRTFNTYHLLNDEKGKRIIFNMPNIKLPGMTDAPLDILKRHGNIAFTLNTNNAPTAQIPNPIPRCMYSVVKIVFTSSIKGMRIRNLPITKWDLIRKNCSHVSSPDTPCPFLEVGPRTQ